MVAVRPESSDRQPNVRQRAVTMGRSRQFWLCQLGGWSAWVMLLAVRDLAFVPEEYLLGRISVYVFSAAMGVLLTSGLRTLYRSFWDHAVWVRLLVVVFGSLGAAVVWQPFRNYMDLVWFGEYLPSNDYSLVEFFRGTLPYSYPLLLLWSGLYFFIKYYQLFQAEREKSLRSEALAQEAQLRMLRYQLNPHFLFNTLNAISTLVLERATDQANEMLTKLSKFLRYSLDHSPLDQVTLAHEIETSKLYLDIEKVRFGERMQVEIAVAEEALGALVPSMLLQPLIENSIKHGLSRLEQGGRIRIAAVVERDRLVLSVADNGPGKPQGLLEGSQPTFTGVGLSNVRNRLKEMYGEDYRFVFTNEVPSGCRATVTIPYQTTRNQHVENDHR